MRFTVTWSELARDELAALWIAAVDRNALSKAANYIDQDLRDDANIKGHAIDNFRFLRFLPLTVLYEVDG